MREPVYLMPDGDKNDNQAPAVGGEAPIDDDEEAEA